MACRIRRIVLLLAATVALAVPATAAADSDPLLAPETACPGQSDLSLPPAAREQIMLCMHRYARSQSGLSWLNDSRQLRTSSRRKARDLRRCHQFSHTACGRDPFYWFVRVGFMRGTCGAAENLAVGSGGLGSVRQMMEAWLHSPEHRANILNPSFDEAGLSLASGRIHGYGRVQIWVGHFGYRR